MTIALKHVSEAPIPPRELNPNIPPELEQTVLWTLNKNASDRPQDADQLITVLEHCREAIVMSAAGERTASMAAIAAGAAAGLPVDPGQPLAELPPARHRARDQRLGSDGRGLPRRPRRGTRPRAVPRAAGCGACSSSSS